MEDKTSAAQPSQVSAEQLARQIFFHVLLNGGEGNPFKSIRNEWFVELAVPKIVEVLSEAALAATPQRGEFLDLQLVEDALFMAAAVDANSDRAERMRELGERIYKLKIGAPKATPPCKHCSHANPHDGPAGSVDDGCTEPGCNCGFYERAEVSPVVVVEPQLSARDFWNQWWSQCKTAMLWHNWEQIAIQFAEAYASSSRVGKP